MSSNPTPTWSDATGIQTLTEYLARVLAIKKHNDQYNHTFQCRSVIVKPLEPKIIKPGPSLSYFSGAHHLMKGPIKNVVDEAESVRESMDSFPCTCGRVTHIMKPYTREVKVISCAVCNAWHTILWEGEKSPEDQMEDLRIEREMEQERELTGLEKFAALFGYRHG